MPENPADCIEVWWGNPAQWNWSKLDVGYRVGICLSEASSLQANGRQAALKNLANCDMLICPSEFASRAYREAPLDMPIKVAHFGISVNSPDTGLIERKWNKPLKFLLAGAAQMRKGTWLGIEAFLRFHHRCRRSKLTVWSSVSTPMLAQIKDEFGNIRSITIDDRTYKDLSDLLGRHHILLSPHLSEGFGLLIVEAMSTGMPGIISRTSAPIEYFSSKYGWWIEMSDMYTPVDGCLPNTGGTWRIPDIDSMVLQMTRAYKQPALCKQKGLNGAAFVFEHLTWEHTAMAIKRHIEETMNAEIIGYNPC